MPSGPYQTAIALPALSIATPASHASARTFVGDHRPLRSLAETSTKAGLCEIRDALPQTRAASPRSFVASWTPPGKRPSSRRFRTHGRAHRPRAKLEARMLGSSPNLCGHTRSGCPRRSRPISGLSIGRGKPAVAIVRGGDHRVCPAGRRAVRRVARAQPDARQFPDSQAATALPARSTPTTIPPSGASALIFWGGCHPDAPARAMPSGKTTAKRTEIAAARRSRVTLD
jgi:hypothetical protein